MCRRVNCTSCGRPTFAGCGAHVEQVLADVPATDRCHCRESTRKASEPQPRDKQPTLRLK
jgi:hypothetical protein